MRLCRSVLALACLPLLVACSSRAASGAAGAAEAVVEGEKFTPRAVTDARLRGMTAYGYRAPEHWKASGGIHWDLDNPNLPANVQLAVEDPGSAEALYLHLPLQMYSLRPEGGAPQGAVMFGLTHGRQVGPQQALWRFVRGLRGSEAKLKLVGVKLLPDLPRVMKVNYTKSQRGLGLKVTYERAGKPVEEEFYSIYYSVDIPFDGPQGRSWQTNWGLVATHSFRAAAGALDRRRPVFGAMMKSVQPNPAWAQRVAAAQKGIGERIVAQQQAGWSSIAEAGRRSHDISGANDAMLASIDQKLAADAAASRKAAAGAASGRSATDHFDDYMRGVVTTDDPYWGTSQHSADADNHWTDGYGTYRNSNDPNYDPNQHESGSWTRMTAQ